MNLTQKLKRILGKQPIDIQQFCHNCKQKTNMTANLSNSTARCKVCKETYRIEEVSLEGVVKELKKLGAY